MAHLRPLFILLLLLQSLFMQAWSGQEESLRLITQADGLGGESVIRQMRDHAGHLWLITGNGVSTYNGKRLLTYKLTDDNRRNLNTLSICESTDRVLYLGTRKGLYAMNYGDNEFRCIAPELEQIENLLADGNTIYAGCRDGLHIYDGKRMRKVDMGQHNHLEYLPRHFQKGPDGRIWFITRNLLYAYSPKTGKLFPHPIAQRLPYNTQLSNFVLCGEKMFVGTRNNGLFVVDRQHPQARQVAGVGKVVSSLSLSHDGRVCVSTEGTGAYVINAATEQVVEHYGTREQGSHHLPTDVVNTFVRTAEGISSFGLTRYGLAHSYYQTPLFQTYAFRDFTTKGLDVRCFLRHGKECIIGTQKGFYYVNEQTGTVSYVNPDEASGGHLITCLQYYNGRYYIGTYDSGLKIFNPQTQAIEPQTLHQLLEYSTVGVIQVAPDGNLWIGGSEGLFIIDQQGSVHRYGEQNSRINGGAVRSLLFDRSGNAWISTGTGLCLYVRSSQSFENTIFPQDFFHKYHHLYLTMGHQQTIYASDMTSVFYTDAQMKHFGTLPIPAKVTEDVCRQFIDDLSGSFWLATEKGLFCTDYALDRVRQFGYAEGVSGTGINRLQLDADGTLWVCTSDGLVRGNARKLAAATMRVAHTVQLYNIRLGGEMLDRGREAIINDEQSLRLRWNFTSTLLSFLPILPDYSKQQGRLYEYRIDGEDDWHQLLDGEEVTVSGLFPGRHHLRVRLAGTVGTESDYTITVLPSWLAILEAIALLVALVLYVAWRRYHKNTRILLEERDEIEGALIEVEQQRQEAEMQVEELREATDALQETDGKPSTGAHKYSRVKLNEDECAEVVSRMRAYIEKNQVYTNPDLKMSELADVLGLSASRLSQIFSLYLKENYYEFINRYRLDEFKRRIEAGDHKRFTITAISEKCGFKKSSFFSTFRKVEGMTPTEYLKKQG